MIPNVPTEFTPWMSLLGGGLIGLSAVIVMAMLGKVTGISGIVGSVVRSIGGTGGAAADLGWRLAFVVGMLVAPFAALFATGTLPTQVVSDNLPVMVVAGLLVGVGTSIGSGCTSGHGVCGLARLSVRSAAAVAVFMASAAITVFVLRHAI